MVTSLHLHRYLSCDTGARVCMQQTLEQDVSSDACLAARCVDTIKKVVFCIGL